MANDSYAEKIIAQIKSARDVTSMPSPGDIAEAKRLAKGNPALLASIQRAEQTAKHKIKKRKIGRANASDRKTKELDSLEESKAFFEDQDIKKSEETATKLEDGKEVSIDDLVQMVGSNCSKKTRDLEVKLEKKIMSKIFAIHKNATNKGDNELSSEDLARRNALREELLMHKKRELHSQAIDSKIGKTSGSKVNSSVIQENAEAISSSIKDTKAVAKEVVVPMLDDIFNKLDEDLAKASKMSGKDKVNELKNTKKMFADNVSKMNDAVKSSVKTIELPKPPSAKEIRAALRTARIKSPPAAHYARAANKRNSKSFGMSV